MNLKHLVVAMSLVTLSSAALADNTGFYLGGKLGASILQTKNMSTNGYSTSDSGYYYDRQENQNKTVFNIGVNAGYDFKVHYDLPIRAELDYTYRSSGKADSSSYVYSSMVGSAGGEYYNESFKIKHSSLMLNGYYDFYNDTAFTPYVGVGMGTSFVKLSGEGEDGSSISKTTFSWSLMAGVSYQVMQNLTANVEYRYLDSGKVKSTDSSEFMTYKFSAKLYSNDINIGIRYAF